MGKRLLAVATVLLSLAIALGGRAAASTRADPPSKDQYAPGRVTICHQASTKPVRFVDRTIPRASLAAHLRHGDTVGPCVYGSVTNRGAVALKTGNGRSITVLTPRRLYSIVVRDPSSTENFHMSGNGVDKRTSSRFVGTARWKITFSAGRYRYRSDARPGLRRFVTVR